MGDEGVASARGVQKDAGMQVEFPRVLPSGSIDIAIAAEFTQLLCSLRTHQ